MPLLRVSAHFSLAYYIFLYDRRFVPVALDSDSDSGERGSY
jgi:hypothetical protein